jgi:TPR repeat protein
MDKEAKERCGAPAYKYPGDEELNAALTYRYENLDPDGADKYYRLLNIAADKGNRAAMGILAEILINGEIYLDSERSRKIPRDPERAAKYLIKLTEEKPERKGCHEIDNPEMLLAELYQKGDGVEYDIQKAVVTYEREALRGSYVAMIRLEKLYFSGAEGFPRDYAKAAYWSLRAFANDHNGFDPDNDYCMSWSMKDVFSKLAEISEKDQKAYQRGLAVYKSDAVEAARRERNKIPTYNDWYHRGMDDEGNPAPDRGPDPYEALRRDEGKAAGYYAALWNDLGKHVKDNG